MTRPPDDLQRFCEQEHPRLVGAMTLYTADQPLAEELAQEALVRVCERWDKVKAMPAPGAWAHRVAMNLAKSRFWRRALERRVAARSTIDEAEPAPSTAEAVAVREAVSRLGPRQREAVLLRYFAGFGVDDAAQAMGVSASSLKSLTHRANQQLRAELDDDLDAEVDHAY